MASTPIRIRGKRKRLADRNKPPGMQDAVVDRPSKRRTQNSGQECSHPRRKNRAEAPALPPRSLFDSLPVEILETIFRHCRDIVRGSTTRRNWNLLAPAKKDDRPAQPQSQAASNPQGTENEAETEAAANGHQDDTRNQADGQTQEDGLDEDERLPGFVVLQSSLLARLSPLTGVKLSHPTIFVRFAADVLGTGHLAADLDSIETDFPAAAFRLRNDVSRLIRCRGFSRKVLEKLYQARPAGLAVLGLLEKPVEMTGLTVESCRASCFFCGFVDPVKLEEDEGQRGQVLRMCQSCRSLQAELTPVLSIPAQVTVPLGRLLLDQSTGGRRLDLVFIKMLLFIMPWATSSYLPSQKPSLHSPFSLADFLTALQNGIGRARFDEIALLLVFQGKITDDSWHAMLKTALASKPYRDLAATVVEVGRLLWTG